METTTQTVSASREIVIPVTITLFGEEAAIVLSDHGVELNTDEAKVLNTIIWKAGTFMSRKEKAKVYHLIERKGVGCPVAYFRYLQATILWAIKQYTTKEMYRLMFNQQGGVSLDLLHACLTHPLPEVFRKFTGDPEVEGDYDLFMKWGKIAYASARYLVSNTNGRYTYRHILESPIRKKDLIQDTWSVSRILTKRMSLEESRALTFQRRSCRPMRSEVDRRRRTRLERLSLRRVAKHYPMGKVFQFIAEASYNPFSDTDLQRLFEFQVPELRRLVGKFYGNLLSTSGECSIGRVSPKVSWIGDVDWGNERVSRFMVRNWGAFADDRVVRGVRIRALLDELTPETVPDSLGLRAFIAQVEERRVRQRRERQLANNEFPFSQLIHPLVGVKEVLGWKVTHLACSEDIEEEGSRMRHCVGQYVREVCQGTYAVYHLEKDGVHATLGMVKFSKQWQLQQVHTVNNGPFPDQEEMYKALRKLLK